MMKNPRLKSKLYISVLTLFVSLSGVISACNTLKPEAKNTETAKKYNVLYIMCDDLNDAVEGMGGNAQTKTPNMRRLAEEGILFTNAHSNHPICAPSRASLFSGMYPNKTGVMDFYHWSQSPVLKDAVSLFNHFKNNGYEVYGTGKLHHFAEDFEKTWIDEKGKVNFGQPTNYGPFPYDGVSTKVLHPSMSYLADFIEDKKSKLWSGRWEHCFGPLSDVPSFKPDPKNGVPGFNGWFDGEKPFRYVSDDDRDLMPDEVSANWAVARLQEAHEKSFMLAVGFMKPHTALYVPQKYFDMFPLETIQLPPYKADDLADCQDFVNYVRRYGFDRFDLYKRAGGELLWKKFVQAYLASVAFADDQLGVVLKALKESKYADNTIVVFTSDHGFHLGEKDFNFKDTNWEEASRVPLIISVPNQKNKGKKVNHAVSLIDIYPTLNDLCGISNDPNKNTNHVQLDGFSLRPFLDNPNTKNWKGPEEALIATYGEAFVDGKWVVNGDAKSYNYSLRSKDYRYTRYENGAEELYNHKNDPNEWDNLAKNSDYKAIKESFSKKLDDRLKNSLGYRLKK